MPTLPASFAPSVRRTFAAAALSLLASGAAAAQGIEAVEFYRTGSNTPPELRTDIARCGTLVIWTRDR